MIPFPYLKFSHCYGHLENNLDFNLLSLFILLISCPSTFPLLCYPQPWLCCCYLRKAKLGHSAGSLHLLSHLAGDALLPEQSMIFSLRLTGSQPKCHLIMNYYFTLEQFALSENKQVQDLKFSALNSGFIKIMIHSWSLVNI